MSRPVAFGVGLIVAGLVLDGAPVWLAPIGAAYLLLRWALAAVPQPPAPRRPLPPLPLSLAAAERDALAGLAVAHAWTHDGWSPAEVEVRSLGARGATTLWHVAHVDARSGRERQIPGRLLSFTLEIDRAALRVVGRLDPRGFRVF